MLAKLDVARRKLGTAMELFLGNKDPVRCNSGLAVVPS
ncbi:hypothetical protein ACVILJ_007258 [Bradyrhizobium diazoefficiens]